MHKKYLENSNIGKTVGLHPVGSIYNEYVILIVQNCRDPKQMADVLTIALPRQGLTPWS